MPDNRNTNRGCQNPPLHGWLLILGSCLVAVTQIVAGSFFVIQCPAKTKPSICVILTGISVLAATLVFWVRWQRWLENFYSKKTAKWIIVLSAILTICFGVITAIVGVTDSEYPWYPASPDPGYCEAIEYLTIAVIFAVLGSSSLLYFLLPEPRFYIHRPREQEEVVVYTVHAVAVNVTTMTED